MENYELNFNQYSQFVGACKNLRKVKNDFYRQTKPHHIVEAVRLLKDIAIGVCTTPWKMKEFMANAPGKRAIVKLKFAFKCLNRDLQIPYLFIPYEILKAGTKLENDVLEEGSNWEQFLTLDEHGRTEF